MLLSVSRAGGIRGPAPAAFMSARPRNTFANHRDPDQKRALGIGACGPRARSKLTYHLPANVFRPAIGALKVTILLGILPLSLI